MMNFKVINDKQNFPVCILYETLHKIYKALLGHVLFITKEMAASLIINRRNHIDFFRLRERGDGWCLSFWCKSFDMIRLVIDSGFISPKNYSILFFLPVLQ